MILEYLCLFVHLSLKLLTQNLRLFLCLLFPKIKDCLLCFDDVEQWVVLCTPPPKITLPSANFTAEFSQCRSAMGLQCEQEGAEHTALGTIQCSAPECRCGH